MKKIIVILCITFSSLKSFGQAPALEWQKCLGSSTIDAANGMAPTNDGGFIVAGYSDGYNGDVTGNHGNWDYWVVKLSSFGTIQWEASLGGTSVDVAYAVEQTADGGYIIAGESQSNNGDVTGNHGSADYWIAKLSSSGSLLWQRSLGGSGIDYASSVQQTSDGGYIVAGNSNSNSGDVSGNHGQNDYWIIKLASTGNLQWQVSLGGTGNDYASKILQSSDGGYIVAGSTESNDGDVSGNHGLYDCWVVKLSTLGTIQWKKAFGGSQSDYASDIQQTSDGGFIVTGDSYSNDGDVSGNHGSDDMWVVKISSAGSLVWQKCMGGSSNDWGCAIEQTTDGGYVVAGNSSSFDGDVTGNHGSLDYWLVKLSGAGNLLWEKSMGGSQSDQQPTGLCLANDGGVVVAGSSYSTDGDVTGNHGVDDFWVVKLKSQLSVSSILGKPEILVSPNPTNGPISFKGAGKAYIKITNTLGQKIMETADINNVSLAELPAGMYFVNLFDELGELIQAAKVIKN